VAEGQRWNVLFLISHDQGIAVSSMAGEGPEAHEHLPTPNLQRIADEGVLLTRHFGTAPMCSPARSSLMTGMYPHDNGIVGLTHMGHQYDPGVKTVIHAFTEAGYRTMLVGLEHESRGIVKQARLDQLGYQESRVSELVPPAHALPKHVDEALKELISSNKPWWLTVGTREVHRSWRCDAEITPENVKIPCYLPESPDIKEEISNFTRCLKTYDRFIGQVLDMLDKHGVSDNTIVIATTDHGIALPNAKGLLYDFGCHTLMLFRGPGDIIRRGLRVNALASSIDFAPTICELCSVQPLDSFMGSSYARFLNGNHAGEPFREHVFNENTFADIYNPIRAVRSERFRYIHNYVDFSVALGPPNDVQKGAAYRAWKELALATYGEKRAVEELYDLEKDPCQRHNLANEDPGHPELVHLRGVLDDWLKFTRDPIRNGPYPIPSIAVVDNACEFPHLAGHQRVKRNTIIGFLQQVIASKKRKVRK